MIHRVLSGILCATILAGLGSSLLSAEPDSSGLFERKNLVAWCIVPFDSKKRGPEDRAAMLEKLGFSKFAYDYRAEHIPTFDAEIEALKRHDIELTAWWFPTVLNDEAKATLAVFAKHQVTPQLWVTGGGEPTKSEQEQKQRVIAEAARIRPIAEAAAKVGCKVALYNHGGWFGEPENQIAIIKELNRTDVGIVYNQHHGHDHLDRFPELLKTMKPYLYTLNLNGMVKEGDRKGQKILQLGQGDLDLKLLKVVRDSGYTGPIGILGHTLDDAEERLHDNLDGLDWLLPQLNGKPAAAKPKTRTPVPVAQAATTAAAPTANVLRLVGGKFGQAIDGRAGGAFIKGRDEFHQFPLTVECWTKLSDKGPYNILVASELKSSGTHWELFTMAGTGNFTVYTPGFTPDHCHSTAMICDGRWHHVGMVLEPNRIRLYVDGQPVANQACQRTEMKTAPGDLAIASLVDKAAGHTGLIDEVRISKGIREFDPGLSKPFDVDEQTLGLWHFDELIEQKKFKDATGKNDAQLTQVAPNASNLAAKPGRIEGHWGEDALGFRWTEEDSRDNRLAQMDTGPFFSGSIVGPGGTIYKGIVVRMGPGRTHAICYDTEQMRASAGWTGFLKFDAARFGIIVPPRIDGDVTFTTPILAGWSRSDQFTNHREAHRFGSLPKSEAHYEGLYRHGQRVVLKFTVGSSDPAGARPQPPTVVLESPWTEESNGVRALTRTIVVEPSTTTLSMLVADAKARVRLVAKPGTATLQQGPEQCHKLVVPAHAEPVTVKLLIASPGTDETAFEKLVAVSPAAEDLRGLTTPGPRIWGEPLVTTGEVAKNNAPYVVDTINLPFENPFRALMFCGGHDFLPDGKAFISTLHGDVWLVDGIDEKLERITWRRYATGLFQPLGVKVLPERDPSGKPTNRSQLFVVGRDQITRLHDFDNDGEADFYENFNNDAEVSLNGHEYVTCLETDRAGNFYYVKGNCDSAIRHDGSLLRVSHDGSKLDVFATGFRNPNGMSIGPNDEITVAPQEGEWTPGSAVFDVHQGGFYGYFPSHHRTTPPTDFERPFCWFPRLADNSCGGQIWVDSDRWGPLSKQLLHLSYGQCKLRLLLQEQIPAETRASSTADVAQTKFGPTMNGGSTEFPIRFASGVHRGRFRANDGQLYVTGLKGWVTSAVNDGCFQRVRYTGQGIDLVVKMKTYQNGIALTFTRPLDRDEAENPDNYELEAWNYKWSAQYGSPDLRPSAPGQIGRDSVEPKSVTLLSDNRTVFLELPDLKPVDQFGISCTLRSAQGSVIEQTAYLTLNAIPKEIMSEDQLHRPKRDAARSALLARLAPGVTLTIPLFDHPTTSRFMAWTSYWVGKESPEEVVATGFLKVPFSGEYRFSASAETDAVFEINDNKFTLIGTPARRTNEGTSTSIIKHNRDDDVVVRLRKGITPIRVRHLAKVDDHRFRLMWETDRFPRELVPAAMLFHDPLTNDKSEVDEPYFAGRALFSNHQCARCHIGQDPLRPFDKTELVRHEYQIESFRHAPRLDGIGSRLQPDWLASWLRNPTHLRAEATMPSLLESPDNSSLSDLVAYMGSLRGPHEVPGNSADASEIRLEKGAELFERLGCIACHTFAAKETHPEWNRLSLHFVKSKFLPGQLTRFLQEPHRHHHGSRMPDFRLSEAEAAALADYLNEHAKGAVEHVVGLGSGDVQRGQKLFKELRCKHCHQLAEKGELALPDVAPVNVVPVPRLGCLADDTARSEKSPKFAFSDADRQALANFISTYYGKASIPHAGPSSRINHALKVLRCTACHARDGESARWPEIVAEEGSGKLPESVPQLTWVGEKLQGPWITKLMKGEIRHKTRPWMTARMPGFPVYADFLVPELPQEHGLEFQETIPTMFDDKLVESGRQLTLRDGGLDCRQCHAVGNEKPRGDAATQIALGINFAFARDRLRPEFAMRQMFDPPRYDVGSRMPRFAPDLQTTAVKKIEGGNAKKQFEAIKQYLWSLKAEVSED